MLRLAEYIDPTPNRVWKLAQQCGIVSAVGGLPFKDLRAGERVSDLAPLTRMKQRYEAAGSALDVIEARPPLNKAKRGLAGRDGEIDQVCALLENMGRFGIPVWCYEWMTDFNWVTCNLFEANRQDAKPAGAEVAFVTDTVKAEFDEAVAAGAMSVVEPMMKPWGQTIFYVRDLNGLLVEICSRVSE